MASRLEEIIAATARRVAESKRSADLQTLEQRADAHVPRGFRAALQADSESGVAVIAELKKASPSKGLIRADFEPRALAFEMQSAGAAALSVLTDPEFFQGSLQNLATASAGTHLPCLRKDFILDEFQILEARAYGADAVLLIVAALSPDQLNSLSKQARRYGLDVLCEAHDEDELKHAVDCGCDVIGVNSRDLRSFKVDLETVFRLADQIPENVVAVAESGIQSGNDIARLRAAGYDAFLVGEWLMRAPSPGAALQQLIADARASIALVNS
jgi:indole-3-glycerol phosphate synthase